MIEHCCVVLFYKKNVEQSNIYDVALPNAAREEYFQWLLLMELETLSANRPPATPRPPKTPWTVKRILWK